MTVGSNAPLKEDFVCLSVCLVGFVRTAVTIRIAASLYKLPQSTLVIDIVNQLRIFTSASNVAGFSKFRQTLHVI
jgi:hypothetical protein